jgi:YVTN family beta-propeller protein
MEALPNGNTSLIISSDVGLYVTNEMSGELTVLDAATLAPIATIPLGKRPRRLASSPDGTRLDDSSTRTTWPRESVSASSISQRDC